MLTLPQLKELPAGKMFATGVLPNSPEGIYMTNDGGELRWVAKKGGIDDWAIYCHWSDHTEDWILQYGDKVTGELNIKRCVPCTNEVYSLYRR